MRRKVAAALVFAVLGGPGQAQLADAPRAILQRAIAAHGGEERLGKVRSDKVKVRGVLVVMSREVRFVAETTVQLPSQFKNVLQFTANNHSYTVLEILNGEQAFRSIDGQPQKMDDADANRLRETLQLNRAIRLLPLLTDRKYTLAALPETKVRDRPALGLRVTAKGDKELLLYFDRETALLVKTEHAVGDKSQKEVRQEEYYGDFRDLGGYRRPVKVSAFRDGTKVMDAELTEVKYYERIDDAEFAKP